MSARDNISDAHLALAAWQDECSRERPDLVHDTQLRRDETGTWCCSVTSRGRDVYRNGLDYHAHPLEAVRLAIGRWAARRYVSLEQNHRAERRAS